MRAPIITLAVFFLLLGGAHAEETDLFARANSAYASGKYADAIRDFESIAKKHAYSAPLCYNLGNAYFRDSKTGPAILNYERAMWLNPSDPDVRANLRFARKTSGLFEPTTAWWQFVPSWISLNVWSWMACVSWTLLCAILILRMWKRGLKWTSPILVICCVALGLALTCALIRIPDLNRAVVLVNDAPLRVAPLDKSAAPSTLKAGDVVRIENRRGSFLYLETEDGKTGWTTDREVAPIISHF